MQILFSWFQMQFFYLAHILCSCVHQYECDDVLDGFWGPGSETVPGQIFASINFRGLEFIREYIEHLYTAKISMYTVWYHNLVEVHINAN